MTKPPFLSIAGSKGETPIPPPEAPKTDPWVADSARAAVEAAIEAGIQTWMLLTENFADEMNVESFPPTYNTKRGYVHRSVSMYSDDDGPMFIGFEPE